MRMLATAMWIFLLFACPAQSQEQDDSKSMVMAVDLYCQDDPNDIQLKNLPAQFGEEPFARGEITIRSKGLDQFVNGSMWMYVNPETGSFTLLSQVHGDGVTCILVNGNKFRPWFVEPDTDPKPNL